MNQLELNVASQEWKAELSKDVTIWLKDNGYVKGSPVISPTMLARELGIPEATFRDIINGASIATKPEYYAELYYKTQLKSADPRTIPAREIYNPNVGIVRQVNAWSEQQWQEFVKKKERGSNRSKHVQPSSDFSDTRSRDVVEQPRSVRSDSNAFTAQSPIQSVPTFGQMVDGFIETFAQQIGKSIVSNSSSHVESELLREIASLRSEIQSIRGLQQSSERKEVSGSNPSILARELKRHFVEMSKSSLAERRRFITEHGHAFNELDTYLEVYLAPEAEREDVLKNNPLEMEI